MSKLIKFPKMLYVYFDVDGEDVFPIAGETIEDVATMEENRRVGIYDLRETKIATVEVKLK